MLERIVSTTLGSKVIRRENQDGFTYQTQHGSWQQEGNDPAVWVTDRVRPAQVLEYDMYRLLCTPQAQWSDFLPSSMEHQWR